ncbi:transporter family protein [Polaribacter sp. M15]
MNKRYFKFLLLLALSINFNAFAQQKGDTDTESSAIQRSNIQTYTPSILLKKGQWDIKLFNNLYTETKATFDGVEADKPRENYLTSTLEIFTGVTDSRRFNLGVIIEVRSNTIGGKGAFDVFNLGTDDFSRKAITSIAPSIKWQPIESVGKFSVQSSIHIPLVKRETVDGVFLDEAAWNFQNRLFYDYTFPNGNWQLFSEINTQYFFGDKEVATFDRLGRKTTSAGSFATNTFIVNPGLFLSYFPSDKSTVLGFVQHTNRFGDFTQDFTALGFGGKYQLTDALNLEVLYSKFVRGTNTGLGESFNIGLRVLF